MVLWFYGFSERIVAFMVYLNLSTYFVSVMAFRVFKGLFGCNISKDKNNGTVFLCIPSVIIMRVQ